ncbi:MAG: FHA domain-containing protein [Planctomycetota bacterium]
MPQLIIKWGHQEHRLSINTPQISIGRSDKNQLQLKNDKISRYHFQIAQTPSGYLLSDFGSSNGTFLNGQRIERKILQNNDTIKISDITIIFLAGSSTLPTQGEISQEQLQPTVITNSNPSTRPVLSENDTVIITNVNKNIVSQPTKNLFPSRPLNSQQKPLITSPSPMNQIRKNEFSIPSQATKINTISSKPNIISADRKNLVPQPASIKTASTISRTQTAVGAPNKIMMPPQSNKLLTGINTTSPKPNIISADKKLLVSQPASIKTASTISRTQTAVGAPNKIMMPPQSNKPSALVKHKSSTAIGKLMPQKNQKDDYRETNAKPQSNKNKKYYIIGGVIVVVIILIIILVKQNGAVEKELEVNARINNLITEANGLYEDKKFDESLKKYREILIECKNPKYIAIIKGNIEKIESQVSKEEEAQTKLDELISKKKKYAVKDYPELLKEFQSFIKEYDTTSFALTAKNEMESIKRLAESEESERESKRVEAVESEAKTLFDKEEYDAAINKLQEFLDKNPSLNNRLKSRIRKTIADIKKEKGGNSEKK